MKDSQEAIDRVLAGLRDVETPAGMERRLLAAMEERAAVRTGWQWRRWSVGFAAAAVLMAAVLVSVAPRKVRREVVAGVKQPLVVPAPAHVAYVQRRNTEILRSAQNDLRVHSEARLESVTARRETLAGGIPAPPMPLTEQEKLLLRVAHSGDATELTPLIAEVRARQDAEFDAEFQEFFAEPAPVTKEKKTDPTENDKGEAR